ncbi:hypothetical protein SERLA73DRAFT_112794 [Serpula lacrymans var. lacrymans S7.3]|uniref:Aprataxin C2HE/C2H2/C2HC zinc finger domain-containing protein n=2 Tax=Serpula lacrymans var. lacrymans TaxID=341189 RepID=F8Q720_SERL3|nr:uncharacterized protein SERLADRAFT_357670 [Serpula lacrymans var. lacrymans S7.9]EGN95358.1 hypothetical protein SERLA73DRAFT_112794 [Serpula lacrymans var. lacrymans S7.3]EGO20892.1 hypothetical protein SERLADRAFT_357670 [Serpula lacrymans var. lacrymans S7.9]
MSQLTVLRSYALKSNPATLPPSVLLSHSETSVTLFDAFPKSIFHFLILPRPQPSLSIFDLANLSSLLKCDNSKAKSVLLTMKEEAQSVKDMIESEMMKRYGFKWGIWTGFHAVPSMEHLHLHVLSNDLCSPRMRKKQHYQSFHPKHGFFLHLDDVLSWFDAEPSYYDTVSQLKKSQYEPLLKGDFECWKCERVIANMPALKSHLQEEWDKEMQRETAKLKRKQKSPDLPTAKGTDALETVPKERRSPDAA